MASSLLIIDDDPGFAAAAAQLAHAEGFVPRLADSIARGREELRRGSDVLLLDLELPDGSGLDLLAEIDPGQHARVAILTGHPSVETAARAIAGPVSDYLLKPLDPDALVTLLRESRRVTHGPRSPGGEPIPGVVAASRAMREPTRLARTLAATEASIVLTGEAGSGKDQFARALHAMSGRKGRFVRLDCDALPRDRLAEQLLGGAGPGAFEAAAGGTLYVDELAALPRDLQGALLRGIEQANDRTPGSGTTPARIVAASRSDLRDAVGEGRLRDDLYYQVADAHIAIPPLRQRDEDVMLIARRFVDLSNQRYDLEKRLAPQSARLLRRHTWPGNVRELRNAVHRAYLTATDDDLLLNVEGGRVPPPVERDDTLTFTLGTPLAEVERRMLMKALTHCGNDKTAAARLLGISVRTVHNHLARMKHQDGHAPTHLAS